MFTVPNVGSVVLGVAVFLVTVAWWDTHLGVIAAAAASALVTGLTWLLWWRLKRPPSFEAALTVPRLGVIPPVDGSPAPTLIAPDSAAATAYAEAASQVDGDTSGQVLLVASPSPGHGASTVALNLAVSATRAGRRVVLIDGDVDGGGLSSFGRTGAGVGLMDLAAGDVDLGAASRLWRLDDRHRLPFIPRGTSRVNPAAALTSAEMADAVHDLTEHADLLLIDVAPVGWDDVSAPLCAHADGTVLVVADGADAATVTAATERFDELGAPVVGYIVNRAGVRGEAIDHPLARLLKRSLATFLITVGVFLAWNAYQIWHSWRSADRDQLAVVAAAELLPLPDDGVISATDLTEDVAGLIASKPTPTEDHTTFMLVGSDVGGQRADVIIFVIIPNGDDPPILVSLPRDLYLPNRCSQSYTRINANLNGCGDEVNGPTLLALAVEDFTGFEVDHFALFDFDGFETIIDEVGGIEICLPYAVRDPKAELSLPAGCTLATGAQTLGWVRSRTTEELIDGTWRVQPGVSDLTRNARQQELILDLLAKLRDFDSPSDLTRKVRSLTDLFTFDDQLGVTDAISLAWDLRGMDISAFHRLQIPVTNHLTDGGAQVLLPTMSFSELLAEIYPDDTTASGIGTGEDAP